MIAVWIWTCQVATVVAADMPRNARAVLMGFRFTGLLKKNNEAPIVMIEPMMLKAKPMDDVVTDAKCQPTMRQFIINWV